jgi:hypothetical protein
MVHYVGSGGHGMLWTENDAMRSRTESRAGRHIVEVGWSTFGGALNRVWGGQHGAPSGWPACCQRLGGCYIASWAFSHLKSSPKAQSHLCCCQQDARVVKLANLGLWMNGFGGSIGRLSPQSGSLSEVDCCSMGFAAEADSGFQPCCAGVIIRQDTAFDPLGVRRATARALNSRL